MEDQLLRDPEVELNDEILKKEFGDWYPVYKEFAGVLAQANVDQY